MHNSKITLKHNQDHPRPNHPNQQQPPKIKTNCYSASSRGREYNDGYSSDSSLSSLFASLPPSTRTGAVKSKSTLHIEAQRQTTVHPLAAASPVRQIMSPRVMPAALDVACVSAALSVFLVFIMLTRMILIPHRKGATMSHALTALIVDVGMEPQLPLVVLIVVLLYIPWVERLSSLQMISAMTVIYVRHLDLGLLVATAEILRRCLAVLTMGCVRHLDLDFLLVDVAAVTLRLRLSVSFVRLH